jgi:hypothetical protein
MTEPVGFRPEATNAMTSLAAIGERMATDWRTTNAELTNLLYQVGKGIMGEAFLAGYQQLATETMRVIDECCQRPGQDADDGNQKLTHYAAVDDAGRRAVQSAGGATMEV